MPFYEAGEHKVDHPPLFACREHKQFLRLRASFVDEMLKSLEDVVPGNLHEIAAPHVGGDTNAFKLPDHLIPPRVLIYNPDFLKGAQALPYTLVFVDKRFIGIPAAYLTADRFEGCSDCPDAGPSGPRTQQSVTGSGLMRANAPAQQAKQNVSGSGVRQGLNAAPAPGPSTKRLGPPPSPAPASPAGGQRPNATPPPVRPKSAS